MEKKPSGFQIHLSTALVLMFTACLLVCANVEGKQGRFFVEGYSNVNNGNVEVSHLYGWPFLPEHMTEAENIQYNGFGDWVIPWPVFAFLDFCIALMILGVVWLVCELRISWQKTGESP